MDEIRADFKCTVQSRKRKSSIKISFFFEILHFHDKFVGKCTYLPSGKLRGNRRRKIFSPANSRRKYGGPPLFRSAIFWGIFTAIQQRFLRDFSHLFRRAVLGGISAVISPRLFALFSRCGFRGVFPRQYHRELTHLFRSAI